MKLSRSAAVEKLRATADLLESAIGNAKKPKQVAPVKVSAAAKPLKWEEHTKPGSPDKILTCDTVVTYDNGFGNQIKKAVTLRIDPRDPTNVRVDRASTGTWEAIDGGNGAKSIPDAKKIAQKWVEAVAAQNTLTPKVSAGVVKAAVEQPKEGDLVYRRERGLFKLNDTVRGKVVKGKSGLMVRILSGSTVANMPLGKFVPLDDKWFTEADFKKLHASTTVSASGEAKVGTTWNSSEGEKKIEKIEERPDKTDGSLYAWVSKPGTKSLQIIPMDQIAKHIKADEAAYAYAQKKNAAKAKEEEDAANTPIALFSKTLTPAMAAKAVATLEKGVTRKNASGSKEFFKTGELVEHLIKKGFEPHHIEANGKEKEGWGFRLEDDPEMMKKHKLEKGSPYAVTTVVLGKLPYLYGQWLLKNKSKL